MANLEVGCCGAYCKTCKVYISGSCKGCKIGYENGGRDIEKARCKIKVCCMKMGFNSCADCEKFESCETINAFYDKNGYKYKKYKEALLFIRQNGYDAFFQIADNWKNVYGKYEGCL